MPCPPRGTVPVNTKTWFCALQTSTGFIESKRDLDDFARLWLTGIPPLESGYTITLGWQNVSSGSPTINVFKQPSPSADYLTDTAAANAIVIGYNFLATIGPASEFTFPANYFNTAADNTASVADRYFIFEGTGVGEGELVLSIKKGQQIVAQTSTFIRLTEVKNMFEKARARSETVPDHLPAYQEVPSTMVSDYQVLQSLPADPTEDKQTILFVHGINNTEFEWQSSSEIIFKRLYWAGYRGRFASFRWPCAYLPPNSVNPYSYNKGEYFAWKSAAAVKGYLSFLKNLPRLAGYKINILGHSQGNIVVSEALKLGAPFDNYILSQAAVPAHCYDANALAQQKFLDQEVIVPTPYAANIGGYHDYFGALPGRLINYFNENEYALAVGTVTKFAIEVNWEKNQLSRKPDSFISLRYSYDSATTQSSAKYYSPNDGALQGVRPLFDPYRTCTKSRGW
jgi:pimeloyl-ACP methyl ester carboxylesterase